MSFNSTIDKQITDQTVSPSTLNYDSDVEILEYAEEQQVESPSMAPEVSRFIVARLFDENMKYTEEKKPNEVKKEELDEEPQTDQKLEDLSLEHAIEQETSDEEFHSVAEESDDEDAGPTSENIMKLMSKNVRDSKVVRSVQKESSYGTNFPCDHCDYSYRNFTSWYQHVKVHHSGNGLCSEKERTEQLNENQENSESSDDSSDDETTSREKDNGGSVNQFPCGHCSMSFKSESWRNRHMGSEHPEIDRERIQKLDEYYSCLYCPRLYEKHNSILAHLNSQHPEKPRPTLEKLRRTGKNVSTPRTMRSTKIENNKDMVKQSESTLKCDKCPRTFVNIDFLNKHKAIHVKPVEEVSSVIFCDGCGQVFKAAQNLGIHRRTKCGAILQESPSNLVNQSPNVDISQNGQSCFTPPAEKCSIRPQLTVDYARIQDFGNVEASLSSVKQERKSIEESANNKVDKVFSPHSSNSVANVKEEPTETTPVGFPFVDSSRSARASSLAIWKRLNSNGDNERSTQKRPRTSTKCDDSDDECMILPSTPKQNRKIEQDPNTSFLSDFTTVSRLNSINSSQSFPVDPIEKSRLPLSAAIFTRSAQFPKELMIIWSSSFGEDLLSAVSLNPANSVLCLQDLQMFKLNEQHKEILEKSDMVTFNILTSADTTSQWTLISFQQQNLNILRNKLFKNFMDVERALAEHAASQGMKLINVMRFSKYGLFPMLSRCLVQKIMAFNSTE